MKRTDQSEVARKHMVDPSYMGSLSRLNGKPVTMNDELATRAAVSGTSRGTAESTVDGRVRTHPSYPGGCHSSLQGRCLAESRWSYVRFCDRVTSERWPEKGD